MTDLQSRIATGRALEKEGSEQQAIDYFHSLLAEYPDNALVEFEFGGAYDFAGYEAEAIPHYRRAMKLGLPDDELARAYVQLGSSLRNVGEFDEAVQLLTEGVAKFPDYRPLKVFLALAQHSAHQAQAALVTLLDVLLLDADRLDGYVRALHYYTDELR
ncbi:MAG: tetratricopeptide repeat protein [Anaerolineae bacterium]